MSLDETLVRSFGRIKFKVRIITKSARYGIKIYVIADAKTAFVLRIVVYCGSHTYTSTSTSGDTDTDMKKTVKVVKELCQDFKGSHRTIYVDRFYTSLDLLKELDKMDLYVTGTCMRNRIPIELRIAKTSTQFKEMDRGDSVTHTYSYKYGNRKKTYGLVSWKDKDIVYCMTNVCNTINSDQCYRRTQSGRVLVDRPQVIAEYNRNMGGVDVADMRRLHCNSTIMGLNRWWLKLFFYMLDVGTSNSLVLYKLAGGPSDMNIVLFKQQLIIYFVGSKIHMMPSASLEHRLERVANETRHKCVYCEMYGEKSKRTRHFCSALGCNLPLCCIGASRSNTNDCFSLAHSNEEIRMALVNKHQKMQAKCKKEKK